MNKYLNYLVACLLSLAVLSSCSDDNEPTPVPVPDPTPSGYCLMFYMSGGDPEHDVTLMESARQAAAVSDDNVAVTVLHKNSGEGEGEAHNGTHRYTAQNGVLTEDPTFDPGEDFPITDPKGTDGFHPLVGGAIPQPPLSACNWRTRKGVFIHLVKFMRKRLSLKRGLPSMITANI